MTANRVDTSSGSARDAALCRNPDIDIVLPRTDLAQILPLRLLLSWLLGSAFSRLIARPADRWLRSGT